MRKTPYLTLTHTPWKEEQIFSCKNVQGYFSILRTHSYCTANVLRNTSEMLETHKTNQSIGCCAIVFLYRDMNHSAFCAAVQ